MAVAFDARVTGGNGSGGFCQQIDGGTSGSVSMTLGGTSTLLVGVLAAQGNGGLPLSSPAMTWNSVSMTHVGSAASTLNATYTADVFVLVNPDTGAHTLAATWTAAGGDADVYLSGSSWTGTDTTTGITAAHTQLVSDATTVTITSSSDGATLAVIANNNGDPTMNFTSLWANSPLNPGGGSNYTLGGTSNAHTLTGGTNQAAVGIHIIAGSAAAGQAPRSIQQFRLRRD